MDDPQKKEPQPPRVPRPGGRFLSDVLRANVRTLREARGLSQQDLADRMVELGHSWHQTTAGRIERGARGVSAEEVTGLAAALETTVVGLLDPMASGAPEDIDLGSRVLNLLPPHAARQLILNETRPWDTTQRSYVVLWSGNKPVNGGIPLDSEEGLAYLRQTLGGKAPADFIEKIVGLAREAMTPEWKAALRDAVEAEAAREAGGTAP